jgi:hypothetical protein
MSTNNSLLHDVKLGGREGGHNQKVSTELSYLSLVLENLSSGSS